MAGMRQFLVGIEVAWLRLPANARGAAWVIIGTVIFAINDTVVKILGISIHPVQMTFFRYWIGFLLLVPVFWRVGLEGLATTRLPLHVTRSVLAGIGQAGAYYAVVHLLLVDATAVQFSRPLFMTLLAVVMLGETVGRRRWAATIVGFGGVIVMLRPGAVAIDVAWLVALATALIFAVGLVIIRMLASTEPPTRILFYYHLTGMIVFVGPAIWLWKTPTADEWPLLLSIGAMTMIGMVCFIRGLAVGEASIVGPMEYTRLIYAAILGYFVFSEVPSVWTWVGAAIIVASALYIARREAFAGSS